MPATAQQPQPAPDDTRSHCERYRPEESTLYRLVQQHVADFIVRTGTSGSTEVPRFIKDKADVVLERRHAGSHGFLRLRCGECGHEKLVAFSCTQRGSCTS